MVKFKHTEMHLSSYFFRSIIKEIHFVYRTTEGLNIIIIN